MRPNPSISKLLDSAIGKLAANLMSPPGEVEPTIAAKVKMLSAAFDRASSDKRLQNADLLMTIIKTLDPDQSLPLLSRIVKSDPLLMTRVMKDPLIEHRIRYIYRVAEIGAAISGPSLKCVRAGLNEVIRKVFEVSNGK